MSARPYVRPQKISMIRFQWNLVFR